MTHFRPLDEEWDMLASLAVRKATVYALRNLLYSVFVCLILDPVFHGEVNIIMFNHFVVWWNITSQTGEFTIW